MWKPCELSAHRSYVLASTVTACLAMAFLVTACTTDPAVRKRELVQSGDQYVAKNQYAEAIIQYRNAVQVDPTFGEARKKLASSYAKTGDGTHALEEYVRAADLLPRDIDVQLIAGRYLLLARKFEEARGRTDIVLKLQPDNVQALILRGNALAAQNSLDEAIKAIEEAIRLNPTEANSFITLGLVQFTRGRSAEAEAALKKAVELSPKAAEAQLALGNFYWSTGKREQTEEAFRSAVSIDPDNGLANRAMAAFLIATAREKDAERYLRRFADTSKDINADFILADYYLASGRPRDAIGRLEAVEQEGGAVTRGRLARAYASVGDTGKAKTLVAEVLKSNPNDVNAQILKSQLLQRDGKPDEALSTIRSAAASNPSSADAQFRLGRLYASRGDVAGAEAAFRAVLKINPRATGAQLELARLQLVSGKAQESVRTAEEAVKLGGRTLATRLTLVRSLLAAKELSRAEGEVAALLSDAPDSADVHVQAASLSTLKNDLANARRELNRAESISPDSIAVLSGQLAVDLRANDVVGAKARIDRRLAQAATPALFMLAARTYLTTKDQDAAERVLRRAIDADPSNLQPYAMLGQLYISQKKLDQAQKEFESLSGRQARPVGTLTMLGMIHQAQGQNSLAIKRYEEALSLDSHAAVAANNLAWLYSERGENLDAALGFAQTAAEAVPDAPEIMDTLGWVYYKKGLPQLAIPSFQRCVEKAPAMSACHYHLGLGYLKTGDTQRGKASLQRALATGVDASTGAEIRKLLDAL